MNKEILNKLLEKEEKTLKELAQLRVDIRDYWLDYSKENFGVYEGVIVVLKDGQLAKIDSVCATDSPDEKPWLRVKIAMEDGGYSKRTVRLFSDWEIRA